MDVLFSFCRQPHPQGFEAEEHEHDHNAQPCEHEHERQRIKESFCHDAIVK